jgi:hypothetical protein
MFCPARETNQAENDMEKPMNWRETIDYWLSRVVPFLSAALLIAVAVALVLFAPARGAAAVLGIFAGAGLGRALLSGARPAVQLAVLWASAAVTADAAYARLNDQAPVTVANALTKIVDSCIKLAEPLIKGLGLTAGDPRGKVAAVAPDFVWAVILSLILTIVIGFTSTRSFK